MVQLRVFGSEIAAYVDEKVQGSPSFSEILFSGTVCMTT